MCHVQLMSENWVRIVAFEIKIPLRVGKVYIRAKLLIRQELIQVSVA